MASILVVDDEPQMREMLREVLEGAGHIVREAASSEEGISEYRSQPADVVVVDLFMPTKGGLDVIQVLKKDSPEVRMIAMSGVSIRGSRLDTLAMAHEYGALRTFEKPFRAGEIVGAIEELLSGYAQETRS